MDQNLKHRLTGAIILISLAVIFIPVILEGPDNEWTPSGHRIPEPPLLDYNARMDLPRPVETPAPVNRVKKVLEKPAGKLAEPARKKTIVSMPEPEPAAHEEPVEGGLSGWYVQVGSFSRELNAGGLSKRLKLSGYDARVLKVTTRKGFAYRVMVGPGKGRDEARKLRDRLANERQLEGILVNNPG